MKWQQILQDEKQEFSFKRVQTGVWTFLFVILFFINLFTGLMVDGSLLQTLVLMTMYSYTGIVIEGFKKKPEGQVSTQNFKTEETTTKVVENKTVNE